MACSQARHLQAYLEAELPLPARAQLEAHLRQCAACRAELAELERLQSLLSELSPLTPPPDLVAVTLQRARREVVRRRTPLSVRAAAFTATGAAAALLLVVLQVGIRGQVPAAVPRWVASVHADLPPAHQPLTVVATPVKTALLTVPDTSRPVVVAPRNIRVFRKNAPLSSRKLAPQLPVPVDASAREAVALAAYRAAAATAHHDPDLTVAALENVALTYPESRQAAKALLAAGGLARRQGDLAEADVAYRRVLVLRAQPGLSQALAHKALADLRRESVGDDEVALYHYQQAARALRSEHPAGQTHPNPQALVMLADVERNLGQRQSATAHYAAAANSATAAVVGATGEQASTALAEVL